MMRNPIIRAAAAGLAVFLLIISIGALWPKSYRSRAVIRFDLMRGADGSLHSSVPEHSEAWLRDAFPQSFLQSLVQRYQVFPKMAASERVQHVQRALRLVWGTDRKLPTMEISFDYEDSATAQRVTQELVSRFVDSAIIYYSEHVSYPHCPEGADCDFGGLQLLDPASLPRRPERPNMTSFIEIGAALGLIASLASFIRVKRSFPLNPL